MQHGNRKFLLGNEAIAYGILEAGVSLVSGYPGTPSSEIIPFIVQHVERYERPPHVEWSVNEKVALEVAAGASYCDVRTAVVMKHVGLNVAADPLMTLAYTGVKGGLVLIVADDPGCFSSQNEQDSRRYAQFAKIPCLDPSTPQEAYDFTKYAFALSELFEIPVMLRPTTRVSHARASVTLSGNYSDQRSPHFKKDPEQWVMVPAHARKRHTELNRIQPLLRAELSSLNNLTLKKSRFGVVTAGVAAKYVEEALKKLRFEPSMLRIAAYPVNNDQIATLVSNSRQLLIVEELEPVIEEQVNALAGTVEVYGKLTGHVQREGGLTVDTVLHGIGQAVGRLAAADVPAVLIAAEHTLPPRPPVLCVGCPHRATFYALKNVFTKAAIYVGDIGCYTLGVSQGTIDTTLCMGASISMGSGFSAACDKEIVSVIGDSTFIHTGVPGLINAVYNGARLTLVIMDNGTTAMTGHQPHPCTGVNAMGACTVPTPMEDLIKAIGVQGLYVVDPYNLFETEDALTRAKNGDGVQVVIARRPCVISAKKAGTLAKAKKRVTAVCQDYFASCKLCSTLFCPAINYNETSAMIAEDCVGCGVCEQICEFDAIETA
ncbi:MAG: indolepyruvate ferredoxin oxidoreductase subunit alpha [Halobacteriota archaeon]|jgi:indolepyruvate ferredoxin oxidoreductase alpha subunit